MAIKRALLLSTSERYVTLFATFSTLALVSRILTPEEIGVSVIGMSITGVVMAFREFASSTFLIQQKDLSREDIRAAFGVVLALTLIIVTALVTTAPLLAVMFKVAGLADYIRLISVCILIDTVATHVVSMLRRDMNFGRIAAINITSVFASSAVIVSLALAGFSYMSFAYGWFVSACTSTVLAISFRPHFWMFAPSLKHSRAMIRFGGYNGASYLLGAVIDQLPAFLLGRSASLEAAAMYNRSLTLSQIPDKVFLGGALPVILPAFASVAREGGSVKNAYLRALEIVTVLQWPALLGVAILAETVVDIMLGHQWQDAVPMIRILSMAYLFTFSFSINSQALMAIGAVRDVFIRAVIIFPVAVAVITAAALLGGLHATAWSMMFVMPFRAFVSMHFACRRLSVRWTEILVAVRASGITALATAAGPLAVALCAEKPFEISLQQAPVAVALGAAGWFAGLWFTKHPMRDELLSVFATIRTKYFPLSHADVSHGQAE